MPKIKSPKRHHSQIPLLLSTDITGIFALKPELFYHLFQTLSADCGLIDGVEFLPFRFSQNRVKKVLNKFNIPITGIHGPVSWNTPDRKISEKMFIAPFSLVMPSLSKVLKTTQQAKPHYLLFHEPDLENCCVKHQLIKHFEQDFRPIILLENVYRPNSLKISLDKAKKIQHQTQAGVMIDLVHLLMEVMEIFSFFDNFHHKINSQNIDHYWSKMLFAMDKTLEQLSMAGLHIPIGTNRDSLPWPVISTKHWQQLATLIDKHQKKIIALTLENQQPETIISLNQKDLPSLIRDKKTKIKTLIDNRVL